MRFASETWTVLVTTTWWWTLSEGDHTRLNHSLCPLIVVMRRLIA